jgi:hypothetical protein
MNINKDLPESGSSCQLLLKNQRNHYKNYVYKVYEYAMK